MKNIRNILIALFACVLFTQCEDYLQTSTPENNDDAFITSTPSETFKALSWVYADYRQNGIFGVYRWNDAFSSDAELYPENNSANNLNARLKTDQLGADVVSGAFNALYTELARAAKIAEIIAGKQEYKDDVASGKVSDWTQLYGEAITLRAMLYFDLVKHCGDVPYGYENTLATDYSLTSRFDIYDDLIASVRKVEPLMYPLGEGSITAERISRTYADALIGQMALFAGSYQTIRTDVDGLYGSVQFDVKATDGTNNCEYVRRTDYQDYIKIAKQYLQAAIDNEGTCHLITSDDRASTAAAANPFQRHFQYCEDLQISPESIFEIGTIQGMGSNNTKCEYPYAFGRPSNGGGSNAAPCKTYASLRIVPTVYYGDYDNADKRRDASVAVTGSKGDGNEMMISFKPGNKDAGGIATNKWDENRMNPPYVTSQRQSGINWPVLRMADVILMLAEAKADLGENDAIGLVNQIRERAFGDNTHDLTGLTGQSLKDAVYEERKLELLGEVTCRFDMIRSGEFAERAMAVRSEMTAMINDLQTQGYHQFANGNVISNYIYTKMVHLDNPLTDECTDPTNPALFPGWRGQYDYSTIQAVAGKVDGTDHNVAIKGLFNYIDTAGVEAATLESQGYVKTNWGIDIVDNQGVYLENILSGITSANDVPKYYWPMPLETLNGSSVPITNGYGLKNQ